MMKRIHIIPSILISLLLYSCAGTRTVSLETMRPAEIDVPSEIKSVLIVDRTKIDRQGLNILEGLVTGEMPGEDKHATQELLNAFRNKLSDSPRYNIKIATERLSGNSFTSAFPDPIEWRKIRELCRKYNAQAVIAIEMFDSDFIITNGTRKVKEKVKVGNTVKEVEVTKYYAEGVADLRAGIRLYNHLNREIIDQQTFKRTNNWEAVGNSVQDAISQLIAHSDATVYLSKMIGVDYAFKIAPMPITIRRSFRGKAKKSPAVETGARFADVGQWENAILEWKKGIRSAPDKEAGYLTYNMAVAYEVLGDMDNALKWAEKSYIKYGNKNAKSYVSLIKRRLDEEERAYKQLE